MAAFLVAVFPSVADTALGLRSTPVREALRVLEAEGFLQHRPHHSPIVSLPDITALTDIYERRISTRF